MSAFTAVTDCATIIIAHSCQCVSFLAVQATDRCAEDRAGPEWQAKSSCCSQVLSERCVPTCADQRQQQQQQLWCIVCCLTQSYSDRNNAGNAGAQVAEVGMQAICLFDSTDKEVFLTASDSSSCLSGQSAFAPS